MTDEQLLVECRKGLDIPADSTAFDHALKPKIATVKMFLKKAGVSDENLITELAAGAIVMGVSDLWELTSGEVKFSPAFFTLVTQLAS